MPWNLEFYRNSDGTAPVEEFFETLGVSDLAKVHRSLDLLEEFGIHLSFPYVSHVEGRIWELRTRASGTNYRVLYFCYTGRRIVLLHAFRKASPKIALGDLELARRRYASFVDKEGRE